MILEGQDTHAIMGRSHTLLLRAPLNEKADRYLRYTVTGFRSLQSLKFFLEARILEVCLSGALPSKAFPLLNYICPAQGSVLLLKTFIVKLSSRKFSKLFPVPIEKVQHNDDHGGDVDVFDIPDYPDEPSTICTSQNSASPASRTPNLATPDSQSQSPQVPPRVPVGRVSDYPSALDSLRSQVATTSNLADAPLASPTPTQARDAGSYTPVPQVSGSKEFFDFFRKVSH
ncbi:hypothetical protein BDZ45DRAFT_748058 [Acephala macrosclerotiorum]|nr:hypothetical protein BDZ45DRAFT_748058 [Acephala macrosclerotiorum]